MSNPTRRLVMADILDAGCRQTIVEYMVRDLEKPGLDLLIAECVSALIAAASQQIVHSTFCCSSINYPCKIQVLTSMGSHQAAVATAFLAAQ